MSLFCHKTICELPTGQFLAAQPTHAFSNIMALQGEIFRQVKSRKTLRFIQNQQAYFAKLHYGVGWREIIKDLVQLRLPVLGAENEWRAIQRLTALNIATLKLIAYGKRGYNPARQQSFIITEELTNTISLEDFCRDWKKQAPNFQLKRALILKLAQIARKIHHHGLNHRDFYLCHFLLQLPFAEPITKPDQLIIFLTDLHRMQIRQRVPQRWLIKDLASLYFSAMDIGLNERDLWYFLKHYYQTSLRDIVAKHHQVLTKIILRAKKLYAKTYFYQASRGNYYHYYDQRYANPELHQVLLNPDLVLATGKLIKHDATTSIALVEIGTKMAVLKRYNAKNIWHRLRRAIKPTRAANCWHAAQELLRLNINTPRPIAVIEKRFCYLRGTAYFLMEFLPGTLLSDVFKVVATINSTHHQIISTLIRLLKKLRICNISHGDLKATNLLVIAPRQIALLDLDAMRHHCWAWSKNKAQARDWQRFLKNWQNQPQLLKLIYQTCCELRFLPNK